VTAIDLFRVPPGEDGEFLARWDGPGVLYRALREDVDFRFVAVAEAGGGAEYLVVRDDGEPDTGGGVTLINAFEVPDGDDDAFLAGWDAARAAMAEQQGYLGTRLHRASGPAEFRFVNVARWSSPLMFARALDRPAFREAAGRIPFRSHPGLYLPI
jgi:heme-degrading monooxygenase HmoA